MPISRRKFIKLSTTAVAVLSTGIVSAKNKQAAEELLAKIAGRIGTGLDKLSFGLTIGGKEVTTSVFNIRISENTKEVIRFTGSYLNIN